MNLLNKIRKVSIGNMLAFLSIIIIILPIMAILGKVEFQVNDNWVHFKQFLLPDVVNNTVYLVLFTLLFSGIIGVSLAVIVSLFDFPLKKFFKWFLYIPITIPPYIAAYVYAGMLGYTGVIQKTLRDWNMDLAPSALNIMNINGAVFIYTITLYPYVYGIVRSFLENHSAGYIDIARVHGLHPIKIFTKVIFPLIRIPLIGGLMLIMMEVISDYGVVKYFNIRTVSTAIFGSWFGMGETSVAIRLSFYVMVFIISIQMIEEVMRGKKRYTLSTSQPRPITPIKLRGLTKYIVLMFLFGFTSLAFVIPVGQMLSWSILAYDKISLESLNQIIFNTLFYSGLASSIILLINIFIAHRKRWMTVQSGFLLSKLTQLGYSMPGAIIAVGTITTFVTLDHFLHPIYQTINPDSKTLVLSTSIIMLVFAFVSRYMAVGFNHVNAAFSKVGTKYNEAARTLGVGRTKAMLKVELPMMKNALVAGFIITFIDILKELPLTLLLRPFNYNTLASRVYEYASDERIMEASLPALIIILISILALALIAYLNKPKGGSKSNEFANRKLKI